MSSSIHSRQTGVPRNSLGGRKISAEGIKYDPDMIESLLSLFKPETAANLQMFLCGENWTRSSILEHASEVAPLQKLLGLITRTTRSAKGSQLRIILLK